MASKIDYSEGSFMAELEGMESKRLEAATDFAGKLEDRYDVLQKWFTYKMTRFGFFCQVYFSPLFINALSNLIHSLCRFLLSQYPAPTIKTLA